jgi:hypothetical protein
MIPNMMASFGGIPRASVPRWGEHDWRNRFLGQFVYVARPTKAQRKSCSGIACGPCFHDRISKNKAPHSPKLPKNAENRHVFSIKGQNSAIFPGFPAFFGLLFSMKRL